MPFSQLQHSISLPFLTERRKDEVRTSNGNHFPSSVAEMKGFIFQSNNLRKV